MTAVFNNRQRWATSAVPLVLLVLCVAGCASDRTFTAYNLPPELVAPIVEDPNTLDLSRLSAGTADHEVIERSDILEVEIATGLSADDNVRFLVHVSESGMAALPEIGTVSLAGYSLDEVETIIARVCRERDLYLTPHVTVQMKRKRMNRITVVGAVEKPGIYELANSQCDLLSAIVSAGGLSEDAGVTVKIRMPSQPGAESYAASRNYFTHTAAPSEVHSATASGRILQVNLAEAAQDGTHGHRIPNGSVVTVEKRPTQYIQVIGLVRRPGRHEYEYGQEMNLLDALALAEGVSSQVADKVLVIRSVHSESESEAVVIEVSLREAKRDARANLRLAPGDTVSVELSAATIVLDTMQLIRFAVGASLGSFL